MPAMLAARLYRILPLLIILAILAVVIYMIVSWRHTPARAKEVLITVFTWIDWVSAVFFGLATAYAWLEGNAFVADFFLTCAVTMLVIQFGVFLAKRSFLKHHPNYQWRVNASTLREKMVKLRDRFKPRSSDGK